MRGTNCPCPAIRLSATVVPGSGYLKNCSHFLCSLQKAFGSLVDMTARGVSKIKRWDGCDKWDGRDYMEIVTKRA